MIPTGHLFLIDYFWLFLPMIVNFWLSFDDCVWELCWLCLIIVFYDSSWLSFDCLWWLCLMIVFYDSSWLSFDCLWWFFLLVFFYWVLIVLDNCLWELWLLITFDDFFICTKYVFLWVQIVSFKTFWYHLTLIHCNKW